MASEWHVFKEETNLSLKKKNAFLGEIVIIKLRKRCPFYRSERQALLMKADSHDLYALQGHSVLQTASNEGWKLGYKPRQKPLASLPVYVLFCINGYKF